MIYPEKLSSKKRNILINILVVTSAAIAGILILINKLTSPNFPWAGIANAGIIYIWITVIYSIKRNTNIAAHVLLQTIIMSLVLLYIDNKLNFYGWSVSIGIPIILMVANVTMFVLSIISYRNYTKYVIYQLIIVFLSLNQYILAYKGVMKLGILNRVAIGVSLFNFIVSLILSYKEFYSDLKCKFHM